MALELGSDIAPHQVFLKVQRIITVEKKKFDKELKDQAEVKNDDLPT